MLGSVTFQNTCQQQPPPLFQALLSRHAGPGYLLVGFRQKIAAGSLTTLPHVCFGTKGVCFPVVMRQYTDVRPTSQYPSAP